MADFFKKVLTLFSKQKYLSTSAGFKLKLSEWKASKLTTRPRPSS